MSTLVAEDRDQVDRILVECGRDPLAEERVHLALAHHDDEQSGGRFHGDAAAEWRQVFERAVVLRLGLRGESAEAARNVPSAPAGASS